MVHRIVIYVDDLLGGGAARVVSYLSRAWVEMGREVVILTNDDGSKQPHYVLHSSVKHRPLGIRVPSKNPLHAVFLNIWRVHLLRSSIKSCKPDLVVSFLDGNNILCLLATRGIANFPVIISERTDPRGRNIGFYWSNLRRVLYPFADALVAQSSSALSFFSERVRRRGRVIPNPVIVPGAVRTQPRNRSESRFTIISLGSLRPVKGHDLLIRAFHEISARFDNWDLVIFGEGPSRPELSSLIADLGLSARVSLPGSTSDPTCKLLDSDIFVLSSLTEGFPNALAEAMAVGLPVISFDCASGPAVLIRDGVDGLLVPPTDIKGLANAMAYLITHPAVRERLASRAPEVMDRFSLNAVIEMWEEVITASCVNKQTLVRKR